MENNPVKTKFITLAIVCSVTCTFIFINLLFVKRLPE